MSRTLGQAQCQAPQYPSSCQPQPDGRELTRRIKTYHVKLTMPSLSPKILSAAMSTIWTRGATEVINKPHSTQPTRRDPLAKYTYQDSPFGPIVHPHFNHPDDKFNKENPPFHGDLALEGDEADAYKALINKKSQEAFEDYMENGDGSKLSPGAKKKWSVYVPYEEEEDKDGNLTGRTLFTFKQNSKIRTAEGVKTIQIGIYDAEGTEIADTVTHGSIVRVRHSFRAIVLKTNQQVGVRMDFSMVQVKELKEGTSGGHGFGSVEGGFKGHAGKASEASNPDAREDSGESDY